MENKINGFVKELNDKYYIQNILVPILDNFKIIPGNNDGVIFAAISNERYLEQYICDGILEKNETIDDHINKVIDDTKEAMTANGFDDVKNSFRFFKGYSNKFFNFKVYLQTLRLTDKILMQYNVFFVDPKSNAFFQLSLTTCPYGKEDFEAINNNITTNMDKTMTTVMDKIRYRN